MQPSLEKLQKAEETANGTSRRQVMEVNERLAEVVGSLYKLGVTGEAAGSDSASAVKRAYAKLELTLELMDSVPEAAKERAAVARALALLFALGAGPRSTVPPLRRSSTGMPAVRIPRTSPTGSSSPAIELGEIEAHALGLDLDTLDDVAEEGRGENETEAAVDQPSGSDRRSSPRIGFEVEVGFVSETNFYAGLSMDVSTGGLFVATYRLQPIGSTVAVTFVLPNGHAVTTDAVVRWVREASEEASPGMGLAFDLDGEDLTQVCSFCKRRQPLFIDMD